MAETVSRIAKKRTAEKSLIARELSISLSLTGCVPLPLIPSNYDVRMVGEGKEGLIVIALVSKATKEGFRYAIRSFVTRLSWLRVFRSGSATRHESRRFHLVHSARRLLHLDHYHDILVVKSRLITLPSRAVPLPYKIARKF